jgi:hypothetical protein
LLLYKRINTYGIEMCLLGRSPQSTTKPINNTGLGFKRHVQRIFIMSRNLWDFALIQKKEKTKPKHIAMCVAESKRQFAPVLFIAKPLCFIIRKPITNDKIL